MFLDKKSISKQIGKPVSDIVVGLTCSTFDLFHPGHITMLMEAKSMCDYLIVGLLSDPTRDRPTTKNKPVQSLFERYIQVAGCKYVDEVIPFESENDLVDMILTINPDIRIVGIEYKGTNHTGKDLCPIFYNQRRHSFSTSDLRYRVADVTAAELSAQINKPSIS
jgi:glycerol-3-phosphate cytidylyltransferase